jgi:hypothetical protein
MAEANGAQIHPPVEEAEKIIIDTDPGIGAYGRATLSPSISRLKSPELYMKFRGYHFVSLESGLPRIRGTRMIPLCSCSIAREKKVSKKLQAFLTAHSLGIAAGQQQSPLCF